MEEIKKFSEGGLGCTKITWEPGGRCFRFVVSSESHSQKIATLNGPEVESLFEALKELDKRNY